jgi:hypothetical protein
MADIGAEWAKVSGTRAKKSRLMKIGGDNVLKINDYELGANLSVFDAEQVKGPGALPFVRCSVWSSPLSPWYGTKQNGKGGTMGEPKSRSTLQIAGRDYENEVSYTNFVPLVVNLWGAGKC